MKVIPETRRAF